MKREKETKSDDQLSRFNSISKPVNAIFSLIFILIALVCFVPFIFVIIISFTDQKAILQYGYSFFPKQLSLGAYNSLFQNSTAVLTSAFISISVTVCGTTLGVLLNALMGYVLSRRSFVLRNVYTYMIFIPMLFGGGLVASYLVNTRVLYLKDNVLALILPLAVSSFYIIMFRTFFTISVPDSLIESGKVDGASQLKIFFSIVLPISLPAMATIGLFLSFAYWNDWQNALLYVNSTEKLWPLQYMLIRIERDIMFLANNPHLSMMAMADIRSNLPEDGIRMALVVLTVTPIALAYPFFQKYFISGLTIGAVKG